MAMRHLSLDFVLAAKEEISVADRTSSRDCLYAHYDKLKVARHFAVWNLFKLVEDRCRYTSFVQYEVASGWLGQGCFFSSCRIWRVKLFRSRQVLSARLQRGKYPGIVIGESWNCLPC